MSRKVLTRKEALKLLKDNNTEDNVIEHCMAVCELALEIASSISSHGHVIDAGFVESAALLHDIGRSRTHDIRHGIEGADILRDYPDYARVCERHIGAGITSEEAAKLGLPARDYLPVTLEEKVVCYADKLVHGTKRTTLDETIGKFEERLGREHPTIGRIRKLDEEMRRLMEGPLKKVEKA
jgi:uncharacterized protein